MNDYFKLLFTIMKMNDILVSLSNNEQKYNELVYELNSISFV